MTSLFGLTVNMGVTVGPYFGRAQFEFILPLLIAAGVAVLGEAVSVRAWAANSAPVRAGKASHPAPSVMAGGTNEGSSG